VCALTQVLAMAGGNSKGTGHVTLMQWEDKTQ